MITLLVKKLSDSATIPSKKRSEDEGYDIYSNEDVTLKLNQVTLVHTGISAWACNQKTYYNSTTPTREYKNNYWLQIEGRSGLASKGIFPVGGIVDSGYRGEISVLLANLTGSAYEIKTGDRIAQLVIRSRNDAMITEMKEDENIPDGDRGNLGFGSSGR